MARINLLPWRAERKKQRQRDFYRMLGLAVALGLLCSATIWVYYKNQIDGQTGRNEYLSSTLEEIKEKNKELDALDKKKSILISRKEVIEELQANRSQMVRLFDAMVRTIPDGVVLTSVKQEGQILTLNGRSQSNARVSTYLRNLEGSGWMADPDLSIIEAQAQGKNTKNTSEIIIKTLPYVFTLKVKLLSANESAAPEKDGATVVVPAASEEGVRS